MRTRLLGVVVVAFIAALSTGCGGSSAEADGKRYAELQCKAQKLAAKGDMSDLSESLKLANEATAMAKEMKDKYSGEDYQKFTNAYLKALEDCK
ncbi:MAG: hypothetical protein J5I53_09640 [Bradyrhizobiaceae bacterium]|nr:hypothetical protein [Bradyrhizobiaceae bacterium]